MNDCGTGLYHDENLNICRYLPMFIRFFLLIDIPIIYRNTLFEVNLGLSYSKELREG